MKKEIICLGIVLLAFMVGCTDDFEEINTPKDAATLVEPGIMFHPLLQNPVRNFQRNINLYPDLFSQYWANTVSIFESPRYEYLDGHIGNQWNEFYSQTLPEANQLMTWYGDDPLYTNAMAQLEVWICSEWSRMLQTYGDMPYFGAGLGAGVAYNSEQDIYYDLFERLTKAVNTIGSGPANQYNYKKDDGTNYDLLFNGDLDKWKRFGNSMRLRLAMRLANVDPTKAQAEAAAAIADGVMTSNDDVAHIPLWSDGWYDYLHQTAYNWNNVRASKTFTDLLYNQSTLGEDPRARIWLDYKSDSPLAGNAELEGLVNGYDVPPSDSRDFATMNLEGGYVGFTGDGGSVSHYLPYMFYSEVLFLRAEAALRGWVAGDANALYLEGVQASMDFVGVEATPATDYINGLTALSGSNEAQLKQLITQKYIANFPNGVEAWADFRRTDYPDITLPVDGVSSNSSVASGTWVKRIRYSDNAHLFDTPFMPAAQNTVETDRMDIRLWWDTTDTKAKSGGLMSSNF